MSAAVWSAIGYRLFTTLVLGYWEITNPCHLLAPLSRAVAHPLFYVFRSCFYNSATQREINENTHFEEHGMGYFWPLP
jgi:hypothetical protein